MYFLVYAFFMCELQKIFFLRDRWIINVQIFSLLMQLFMGHIVPYLHFIERENIFSLCVSSTQFLLKKTWFMSFYLSPPPLLFPKTFFPKTCFVFPIFIGGEIFLTFVVLRGSCCSSQGELLLFIGGVVSIFYRVELLSLDFCQYMTKGGRFR